LIAVESDETSRLGITLEPRPRNGRLSAIWRTTAFGLMLDRDCGIALRFRGSYSARTRLPEKLYVGGWIPPLATHPDSGACPAAISGGALRSMIYGENGAQSRRSQGLYYACWRSAATDICRWAAHRRSRPAKRLPN
jgi:hypothetical protein